MQSPLPFVARPNGSQKSLWLIGFDAGSSGYTRPWSFSSRAPLVALSQAISDGSCGW